MFIKQIHVLCYAPHGFKGYYSSLCGQSTYYLLFILNTSVIIKQIEYSLNNPAFNKFFSYYLLIFSQDL